VLASSFHVRKNTERVLNASSDWNEQNVPDVRFRSNLACSHTQEICTYNWPGPVFDVSVNSVTSKINLYLCGNLITACMRLIASLLKPVWGLFNISGHFSINRITVVCDTGSDRLLQSSPIIHGANLLFLKWCRPLPSLSLLSSNSPSRCPFLLNPSRAVRELCKPPADVQSPAV